MVNNKFIIVQVRNEENHIASSFRIEYENEQQTMFALERCFPILSIKGVVEIENNELGIKIGNVGVQKSQERTDRFNRTGN